VVSAALITPLGSLLAIAADWHQAHLLAAELDLELIAWLQAEHGGVSLAHQQVAVALHGGHIAELAAGGLSPSEWWKFPGASAPATPGLS